MKCEAGKVKHKSHEAALVAAAKLMSCKPSRVNVGVYWCESCDAWHIGHVPKQRPSHREIADRSQIVKARPRVLIDPDHAIARYGSVDLNALAAQIRSGMATLLGSSGTRLGSSGTPANSDWDVDIGGGRRAWVRYARVRPGKKRKVIGFLDIDLSAPSESGPTS